MVFPFRKDHSSYTSFFHYYNPYNHEESLLIDIFGQTNMLKLRNSTISSMNDEQVSSLASSWKRAELEMSSQFCFESLICFGDH